MKKELVITKVANGYYTRHVTNKGVSEIMVFPDYIKLERFMDTYFRGKHGE